MTNKKANKIFKNYFKEIILIFSFAVIALTLFSYYINNSFSFSYDLATDKLGQFGDFIGGFLGTVLTMVATYYIYKTYHSQKDELDNQKKLINQQQFESTFFNLLNIHIDIKKNLNIDFSDATFKPQEYNGVDKVQINGLEVFIDVKQFTKFMYSRIIKNSTPVNEIFNKKVPNPDIKTTLDEYHKLSESDKSDEKKNIEFIYKYIFSRYQNQISHYCRNVYHILKFIRENEEEYKFNNCKKYSDILQSQLNVDEQFVLFYNFIIFDINDNDKFLHPIDIVNHYSFLENIGIDNLISKEHENFYNFIIKGSDRIIKNN